MAGRAVLVLSLLFAGTGAWVGAERVQRVPRREVGVECPMSRRFYKPEENMPQTMLYSFEGSGNTWTRFLLENSTGIYTGAIYSDGTLRKAGFAGESIHDNTVIAIKSHLYRHEVKEKHLARYNKMIHLVRNPLDALVAERKRRIAGSHNRAPSWEFFVEGKRESLDFDNRMDWDTWLREFAVRYYNATQRHAQVLRARANMQYHLVRYEDLKEDLQTTLGRLLHFLGYDPALAQCPARKLRHGKRPAVEGWPSCAYTKRQLRFVMDTLEWTMAEHAFGVSDACKAVLAGQERGGVEAVPLG